MHRIDAARLIVTAVEPQEGALLVDGLTELHPGRQDYLLWYFGRWFGAEPETVDQLVRHSSGHPCPTPPADRTPYYTYNEGAGASTVATIPNQLIDALGPHCATCGSMAEFGDHNHTTQMVRGLVCNPCNGYVDRSLHPRDCPYVDYIEAPPAAHLQIRYPNRGRRPRAPAFTAAERRTVREQFRAHIDVNSTAESSDSADPLLRLYATRSPRKSRPWMPPR